MASPLTVWSTTADGYVNGNNNVSYSQARSTANTAVSNQYSVQVGQVYAGGYWNCIEGFVSFDTSSVGAGSTVTVATLSLYAKEDSTLTDFTYEARIKDWGASLTTADWASGDPNDAGSLDEYTLVASRSTTPGWSTAAYSALTSGAAFLSNVAQTGTTYLILDSSRHLAGNEVVTYEELDVWASEDGAGTDRDPKLYVEYTEGGCALTVWSTAADGNVSAFDSTWALSRAGTGTLSFDDTYTSIPFASRYVSSSDRYYNEQAFFDFDTSTVGASSTVTAATLSLYGKTASILTSYVIDCFASNWGGTLGTGDFVPGATLEGLTLLANYNLDGGWPTDAYTGFTSTADFLSSIDQAGTTYLVLVSDWQVTNTTPLNNSYAAAYAAEDATGGGGTDRDPKLYVEYTEGGSVLTVWSSTADGYMWGYSTTYATARSTVIGASVVTTDSYSYVGQLFTGANFQCWEAFESFDTSSVDDDGTMTSATLSLYNSYDNTSTDFTVEARIKDWGATLTSADWVSGNPADTPSIDDYTLMASKSTTPTWPTDAYTALTSEVAFLTSIAKTGATYIMLSSDRQLSGTEPTGNEWLAPYSAEDATGGGGTDRDPKLYVEWTVGGDAPTLTTNTVTDITSSTATSGGSITGIGGSAITDYGLCWSKTNPPTITDAHTHDKP